MRPKSSLSADRRGATAVEYALVIAGIGVAVLFLVFLMGRLLNNARSNAGDTSEGVGKIEKRDASFIHRGGKAGP